MTSSLTLQTVFGADIKPYINDIARIRINVFREFPYLYDGSLAYERRYLETYIKSNESLAVLVFNSDRLVGVSTGLPLTDEEEEFKQPFIKQGYDPKKVFYCGESILLKEYRGQGIYSRFFNKREAHARRLGGINWISFCAVQRSADHPRRLKDYQPLDHIWQTYGYTKHSELTTTYRWKDVDEESESDKTMVFWMKEI